MNCRAWPWTATSGFFFRRDALNLWAKTPGLAALRRSTDGFFALAVNVITGSVLIDESLAGLRIHGANNFTQHPQLNNIRNYDIETSEREARYRHTILEEITRDPARFRFHHAGSVEKIALRCRYAGHERECARLGAKLAPVLSLCEAIRVAGTGCRRKKDRMLDVRKRRSREGPEKSGNSLYVCRLGKRNFGPYVEIHAQRQKLEVPREIAVMHLCPPLVLHEIGAPRVRHFEPARGEDIALQKIAREPEAFRDVLGLRLRCHPARIPARAKAAHGKACRIAAKPRGRFSATHRSDLPSRRSPRNG